MGYNWHGNTMSEQMGQCKWCGKFFSLSLLVKFGGYCCSAHYQAGLQRQR